MKRNNWVSVIKGSWLIIFWFLALRAILGAGLVAPESAYFSAAPTIRHLSPESVEVSWTLFPEFSKTTHYQVQVNHALYGSSTKGTREILTGLAGGGSYHISVVTYDNGSAVGVSSPTAVIMAPEAPQGIGIYNIGTDSVGLYWQKVDTAVKYRVYLFPDTLLQEVEATELKTLVTGLTPGSLITLRLTALNGTGESFFSVDQQVQLLPPAPEFKIIENQIGSDWFSLKWDSVEGAVKYKVFVNDDEVASFAASINTCKIENLQPGSTVAVKMTITNATGQSEPSEALIIQLLPAKPVLAVAEVSSFSCTLQWSAANGATYYKIYTNNDWAIFNVPATINNVTLTENIVVGMTATYTVRAGNGTGESEPSNPVVVTYTRNSALIREGGDLAALMASVYKFNDKVPQKMQGKPIMWVYFPPELEGPALAFEAVYFDQLTLLPELQDVNFVGVFTRSVVTIKGARRSNLEWKKAVAGYDIKIPGQLPMVRFYGPDGMLRKIIRISMAIVSPYDIFKELPEVFEKSDNMMHLYQENRQKFETLHKESE